MNTAALPGSVPRCAATWLAATTVAAALLVWVLPDLQAAARHLGDGSAGAEPFAAWLTWLAAASVAACAGWGWWVASVVVAEALTGRVRSAGVVGVPAWGRRLVLAACGALAVGVVVPAGAVAAAPLHREPAVQQAVQRAVQQADGEAVLDGLPLPDRAEGPSAAEVVARALTARDRAAAPPPVPRTPPSPQPAEPAEPSQPAEPAPPAEPEPTPRTRHQAGRERRHVVVAGDSLWSIAERALLEATGAAPTAADVAAYWPVLHAANRDLVGPEPDLIRPGQRLRIPPPHGEDAR